MAPNLKGAITDAVLRRMAGEQSYKRGVDYFAHGHVESVEEDGPGVEATVRGTQDYLVTLALDEGVLDYACDCPIGSEGTFCKHCVAAALAWREQAAGETKARSKAKPPTLAEAAKILEQESAETLAGLMTEWARDDKRLRERIVLYAARRAGPESGAAAAGRAFEKAVRIHGFVEYREAGGWASDVHAAIDAIEQLLNDGQAAAVIDLCESALLALTETVGEIDDSDGCLTELRDRLHDLHLRACQEARPDPVALAQRLFAWDVSDRELDVFYGAASTYAEILGPKGLQAYRALAEAEWAKVPARTAGSKELAWGSHHRITSVMESLARASGDVDALAAVIGRDLSHAYGYLRIGEAYREAGQFDKALEWAEKGLRAFPVQTDDRLREFAANEYHRRKRHGEAMKLMWAAFLARPYLEGYQTLERHAKLASAWPEWRERALAEIRSRIATAKAKTRGQRVTAWAQAEADHTLLAEIFLYEKDVEAAWREAQAGGCSDLLWLKLAVAREKEHPEDAAPIYLKQAEACIVNARNSRYDDSLTLLVKAARAMQAMDRSGEFQRMLNDLRLKYKIKRNFIKLMDEKRKLLN
jgi:uncharacterized Zn finger protein